jgi:putative flavoprotein involved in K+ transport
MNRMLDEIDAWIERSGSDAAIEPSHRFEATRVSDDPALSLDLARSGIETVIWATGYRPDYGWLTLPVFGPRGDLLHDCGVVDAPGLYVLGLPFLRTRKSSFIGGTGDDAEAITTHLHQFLAGRARAIA